MHEHHSGYERQEKEGKEGANYYRGREVTAVMFTTIELVNVTDSY
jgi:hypothetical protein